jgi:O-antigen/teichoic acid export membrane protein
MGQGMKRRGVLIGATSTIVSEAIGRGSAMAFQLLVANRLGAQGYGLVALALASAAILAPMADAGIPNLVLRQVSGAPDDHSLIRKTMGLKAIATPLFVLPLLVWAFLFLPRGEARWSLVVAGAFYGFQSATDLLRQILRARQESTRELLARFAYPLGCGLVLLAIWHLPPSPFGALLALAAGPVALTISYWLCLPAPCRGFAFGSDTFELVRENLGSLLQSTAFLLIVGITSRADAFILDHFGGATEVGRYFAAFNLVTAGVFFGQGLSSYLYPRLHRQKENRARALGRATLLHALLGLALFAGVVFLGPVVFHVVFRSRSFFGAESLLPGMGVVLLCSTLDWLWLSVLVGRDKMWVAILNFVPVIASKILLGIAWVPGHGAQGMVWASMIGQILSTLLGAATAWSYYLRQADSDSTDPEPG